MTYNEYIQAIQALLAVPQNNTDAKFTLLIPRMIEYAELRMCRDFDFLATRTTNITVATVSGSRNVTAPSTFVVIEDLNLISPAGTTNPELGTRIALERVSLDFINVMWPTAATTGMPSKYAFLSDTAVRIAPTPAGVFTCEFIGTTRPTPLSFTNQTNFISVYLPDLLVAASMVFGAGELQNYGLQSDDPKLAMSWETQYQTLKASAAVEEARKKSQSAGWETYQPSPGANVPRDRSAA